MLNKENKDFESCAVILIEFSHFIQFALQTLQSSDFTGK